MSSSSRESSIGANARWGETLRDSDEWPGGFSTTLESDAPTDAAPLSGDGTAATRGALEATPPSRSGVVPAGSSTQAGEPAGDDELIAAGTVLLGKLRVVRLLGQGGMGSVYEVEHVLTRHRRALKILHRRLAKEPGLAARFTREVGIAARIASPFVVETYDAGTLDDGTPYALMELLEGETLAARLERRGPFRSRDAIAVVAQVAQGVVDAHRAGILHRDLKPENVFLVALESREARSEPTATRVRILDFGIARPLSTSFDGATELTAAGAVLGTPHYIAPEYAAAETPDERVDVYALGVILYELLSGRKPFDDENLFGLLGRIMAGDVTPLRELAPHVSPELDAVVRRAMARDPASRYPSAAWLLTDLNELAARMDRSDLGVIPTDVDENAMTVVRDVDSASPSTPPSTADRVSSNPLASPSFLRSFSSPAAIAIIGLSLVLGAALGGALAFLR